VQILWDCPTSTCTGETVLGTATANSQGGFSATVIVPNAPAAVYSIGARGASSGTFFAATYTVKLSFLFSPNNGPQGATVSASGTGFASGESVTLYWSCTAKPCTGSPVLATVVADAGGAFSNVQFTVPTNAQAGVVKVGVLGTTNFVTVNFTVTATLIIVPGSGAHGSAAKVSGTGFEPSAAITVSWNCSAASCPSPVTLATPTTDANGDFSAVSVTIPSSAVGTYSLRAADAGVTITAYTTFKVTS
jgi:large repetitive protein